MTAYTRGMSTTTDTTTDTKPSPYHPTRPTPSASSPNPTAGGNASALPCWGPGRLQAEGQAAPHAYGVHTTPAAEPAPMPIYLGAQNTPTPTPEAEAEWGLPGPAASTAPARHDAPSSSYDPAALLRHLVLLLALLLGLTLALGGWQPHTSDARLGWSHGTIDVVKGTDGDTGSRPLSPNDSGVLPADPGGRPVDLPKAYLGDSSRFAPGVSPWAGPVDA